MGTGVEEHGHGGVPDPHEGVRATREEQCVVAGIVRAMWEGAVWEGVGHSTVWP